MSNDQDEPLLANRTGPPPSLDDAADEGDDDLEALDYDVIHSRVYSSTIRKPQRRHAFGYTGATLAKVCITLTIGILTGCAALAIESVQTKIIVARNSWVQAALQQGIMPAFATLAAIGLALVLASSSLVVFWSPASAGGGVTLVMAYLNGLAIPDFLRPRTLFAKVVGTICTTSSGLSLGPEGPLVHIGAAIASLLTWPSSKPTSISAEAQLMKRRKTGCFGRTCNRMTFDFHNDVDRREFISAGAAAGLASAFGSPIGGVLFSMEEASSFWSRKVMWRSLLATCLATMTLSCLYEGGFSLSMPGLLSFRGLNNNIKLQDLGMCILTSAAVGVMGSLFNRIHGALSHTFPIPHRSAFRLLEAGAVLVSALAAAFFLSARLGECLEEPDEWNGLRSEEKWHGIAFQCAPMPGGTKTYNDLATLFFSVPHVTITRLMIMGTRASKFFSMTSLAIYSTAYFIFFLLARRLCVPGGMFMPSIMFGSAFGGLMGCTYPYFLPRYDVQPGLHALVGATAMLGGVFRGFLSLVVIMVEGTGGIDFIFPIIVAIVVSNWVADHIYHSGAYEADIERLGRVHFLHTEPPHSLVPVTAEDIMAKNVVAFDETVPVAKVLKILRETHHNGFPVLDSIGHLAGLVLRSQLLVLLQERIFVHPVATPKGSSYSLVTKSFHKPALLKEFLLEHSMRVFHLCHNAHRRYLNSHRKAVADLNLQWIEEGHGNPASGPSTGRLLEDGLTAGHRQRLPSAGSREGASPSNGGEAPSGSLPAITVPPEIRPLAAANLSLDLTPFMNHAPLTVRRECSAQRIYILFRTLGLRHLCVVDSSNRVVGIITRKDIARAEEIGHQRLSEQRLSEAVVETPADSPVTSPHARGPHFRIDDLYYGLP